jgi:integrase
MGLYSGWIQKLTEFASPTFLILKKPCGQTRLRDFRTVDGERLLAEIAERYHLARNTLKRTKNLISGIFKCAKRLGCINGVNPMQDVSIPKSRPGGQTYAYSLEEIIKIISILPQPAATVVATTAFTRMRKGEIRGLLWEKYYGDSIWVSQSVWERFISEPKTERSNSPVPVIKPLAEMLRKHRQASGNPEAGLIFVSPRDGRDGGPINMDSLLKWQIKPKLQQEKITWRGWHTFRRGLGTNLYRLGVPDKTIQAILRHSNLSTTMNSYVKSVPQDAVAAIKAFETACRKYAPQSGNRKAKSQSVRIENAPLMHPNAR